MTYMCARDALCIALTGTEHLLQGAYLTSALHPAGLQHFGTRPPVCIHCLKLELSIFSGWMEWPQQDTPLARKDAWTQTYPPRRRIRRAQVQGIGKVYLPVG